jgi:hypothetical protein
MISLSQLWIPIVLAAILVFVASSLVHMVFKWHNSDYLKLAKEDEVRAVIRASNPSPGQYVLPHCADMKDMAKPEFKQKFIEGPVGMLTLRANGAPNMGSSLGLWFAYTLAISVIAAYVASRTLPGTASFLQVCRVAGTISFLAYAGGSVQNAIWMGKPWSSATKEVIDALIYGGLTAVALAWLWPR